MRQNGVVGRAATTANGAAPAMEYPHRKTGIAAKYREFPLNFMERPGRLHESAFFIAVGIPDHNFLHVVAKNQMFSPRRHIHQALQNFAALSECFERLE